MWELVHSSLESMQQHQLAARCFIKETLIERGIVMMFNVYFMFTVDLSCETMCLNLMQPVRIVWLRK